MRKLAVTAGVMLACVFFAGCAANPETLPPGWKQVANSADDPTDFKWSWTETDSGVMLFLYGSSSCPPTPERSRIEGTSLVVSLVKNEGVCTEDYGGPMKWEFSTEGEVEKIFLEKSSGREELPKL